MTVDHKATISDLSASSLAPSPALWGRGRGASSNCKLVPWEWIAGAFSPPLTVDPCRKPVGVERTERPHWMR